MLTPNQLLKYRQAASRLYWYKGLHPLPFHLESDMGRVATKPLNILIIANIVAHRSSEEIHARVLYVLCRVFNCERSYK